MKSLILGKLLVEVSLSEMKESLAVLAEESARESSTVLAYDKLNEELAMELFLLSNFLSFTTSFPHLTQT